MTDTSAPPEPASAVELAASLSAGRTTSRALVEAALGRIADPAGEGSRAFTRVYEEEARRAAEAQDLLRRAAASPSPLAGLPVSVKDLFDVAGETTLAGSRALVGAPPAEREAAIVARLKAAGAVIVGKTNMTEFAFSGVGINPHYGTPGNPFDRARVPGGSSSGAAVSVADGMAAIAIGTDTGGSVRIPAALCGLVGFKPTQRRVPLDGCLPLSSSLDSIGPLARSVADCALADAVLAGDPVALPAAVPPRFLRLGVPRTLVFDDIEPGVARAFERAVAALSRAGVAVHEFEMPEFAAIPQANAKGGFAAAEAAAWHADLLARRGAEYDPLVRVRIERGFRMSAPDYVALVAERARLIAAANERTVPYEALLLPTVPIVAPPVAGFAEESEFLRLNGLLLRNCSLVNFLDRCALTMPMQMPGDPPAGLMLVGAAGADRRLLGIGRGVEAVLAGGRAGVE
jgi:aspartyl-tRNA(Asn)/glutamyl-tRNA(Gln) amidotransferase subunit A